MKAIVINMLNLKYELQRNLKFSENSLDVLLRARKLIFPVLGLKLPAVW